MGHIEELARWVWGFRFFSSPFKHLLGENIFYFYLFVCFPQSGNSLISSFISDLTDDSVRLSVYSGHDYTILYFLSATLLREEYESPVLGYGAYVIISVISSNQDQQTLEDLEPNEDDQQERVIVSLNPTPFRDEEDDSPLVDGRVNKQSLVTLREFDSISLFISFLQEALPK